MNSEELRMEAVRMALDLNRANINAAVIDAKFLLADAERILAFIVHGPNPPQLREVA